MLSVPSSATSARRPLLKSTMSGTWAKTLLATTRSAGPCLCGDLAAGLLAEEHHLGRHALRDGGLGDVGGRLDAEGADAARDDVLEQVAVVAGHLDDERVGAEAEPRDGAVDEPSRVLAPRSREYDEK